MGKRKHHDNGIDKLRKKLKKLEKTIERYQVPNTRDTESEASSPEDAVLSKNDILEDPPVESVTLETPVVEDPEDPDLLDENIINLLGDEGEEKENTTVLHKEVQKRWQTILQNGLDKETQQKLSEKYEIPINCPGLTPPALNDIIKAVLNEAGLNRDKRILEKQKKLGIAISALGKVLSRLLDQNALENKDVIEALSDSGRMLCDIFHSDSNTRRSLIVPGLNKDLKDLINNSQITNCLFGNDLQEKVKACKATKSSAKDLKIPPTPRVTVTKNKTPLVALNSRGPLRSLQQPRLSGPPYQSPVTPRPAPQRQQPKYHHRQQQRSKPQQQRHR